MMSHKIMQAEIFATCKHQGQVRKYTNEPYIEHCRAVASAVNIFTEDEDMVCAAWLHDTLEDTPTELANIEEMFGIKVAGIVADLTDYYTSHIWGNRARRKQLECERLRHVSPDAQTVKLADLIDNTRSIVERDPSFAVVYLKEKQALLNVLTKGNKTLHFIATAHLNYGVEQLTKMGLWK